MNSRRVSLETVAYLLAFGVAAFIRFNSLERLPLTDQEAALALQALNVARGVTTELMPQPGYIMLTGLLFFLSTATDFLARFWPALFGSILVLAPALYQRWLGRGAALVLAFALAFEPGLAALSKQANGTIIAVAAAALAAGFALNRRPVLTGIFTGLALLGSPILWPGLLALVLAWFVSGFHRRAAAEINPEAEAVNVVPESSWPRQAVVNALVGLALTWLVAGTLFLRWPAGLSAMVGSIPAYVRGWGSLQGVNPGLLVIALIAYQPFALILGLIGLIAGMLRRDPIDRFLGWWFLFAFLLALVYPSRQVIDLVWALLPLWALAARQALRLVGSIAEYDLPTMAQAGLTVVLVVMIVIGNPMLESKDNLQKAITILIPLALLLLTSLLMGIGWSYRATRNGLLVGFGLLLAVYSISAAWHAAGMGENPRAELYQVGQPIQDQQLLVKTIGDLATYHNGNRYIIDVTVAGVQSPSLQWALRDFNQVDSVDTLPPATQPSIVITPDKQMLAAANNYRGQDFVWDTPVNWGIMAPSEWIDWLTGRAAPIQTQSILLWARSDLFFGEAPLTKP